MMLNNTLCMFENNNNKLQGTICKTEVYRSNLNIWLAQAPESMLLRLLQLKTLNECIVRLLELNAVADLEFNVQDSIKSNYVCTRPEVGCNIHGVTALTRAKHLAKLLKVIRVWVGSRTENNACDPE